MPNRTSISKEPASAAERKRRQRARSKEAGIPNHDQTISAIGRAAIDICRTEGTLKRLSQIAAQILENKGFNEARSTDAIRNLMKMDGKD